MHTNVPYYGDNLEGRGKEKRRRFRKERTTDEPAP
jgi:hypothetical protein